MRLNAFPMAVCGLTLLSAAAMAQDAPDAGAPALQKPVKEKRICRAEESTGSIMTKRICHTPEQWAAIDGAHGDDAGRLRDPLSASAIGHH